jgi:MYXO-CTERM domain-containing protein
MVNRYVMGSAVVAAMIAGSALATAGNSTVVTFSPAISNTAVTTNWTGLSRTLTNTVPAGNWVDARIQFSVASGSTAYTGYSFALSSLGALSGTGTSPTFPASGNTTYYSASAQPSYNGSNFAGAWWNMPLSTTYTGGSNPLILNMRSIANGNTITAANITFFERATVDLAGSLSASSGTYTRPSTYYGTGSPSSSFSNARYDVQAFQVSVTGTYFVSMMSNDSSTVYGGLYADAFDPLNPLTNLVRQQNTFYGTSTQPSVGGTPRAGNTFNSVALTYTANGADFLTGSGNVPGVTLNAGTTYYYVYGGSTTSTSSYHVYFEGPGSIIPTPGAVALMGLGGLTLSRRRR